MISDRTQEMVNECVQPHKNRKCLEIGDRDVIDRRAKVYSYLKRRAKPSDTSMNGS